MAQICEYSEAGITVRGTYFPPGKRPKEGDDERKLYLAIEATSDMAIQKAKKEVTRLIKEELIRLVSCLYVSRVMRNLVFGISDQVGHKLVCMTTKDGWRLEILDLASRVIVLSM